MSAPARFRMGLLPPLLLLGASCTAGTETSPDPDPDPDPTTAEPDTSTAPDHALPLPPPEVSEPCAPLRRLSRPTAGCDRKAALDALAATRVELTGCGYCHDMTLIGAPKLPGPPWWHPTDDQTVLNTLLEFGLIDPDSPTESLLLLKPLAKSSGGVTHSGGELLKPADPLYSLLVAFLEAAAGCVSCPPE